jgi:two-component system, OmpR family, phosphate regulon sensor histidine kinase PhoR
LVQEKSGRITADLHASVHELKGDKLHFTNVLNNLLDNAIKYCNTIPEISIRAYNQEQRIVVEVKDNGLGILPENQKRIFQKFYRVPTGNVHDVKGFGLGLSYVKTIVEEHRGEIKLSSEMGKGSTFTLFIPLTKI